MLFDLRFRWLPGHLAALLDVGVVEDGCNVVDADALVGVVETLDVVTFGVTFLLTIVCPLDVEIVGVVDCDAIFVGVVDVGITVPLVVD